MIISDVMDDLAGRLDDISALNVLPYEADSIDVPAVLIGLPTTVEYSKTYNRGMDKLILEITVLVSLVDDRCRRDDIAPYADGAGTRSIKRVIETGTYTAFDTVFVATARFDVVSIGGIEYLAVIFQVHIAGQGGS